MSKMRSYQKLKICIKTLIIKIYNIHTLKMTRLFNAKQGELRYKTGVMIHIIELG